MLNSEESRRASRSKRAEGNTFGKPEAMTGKHTLSSRHAAERNRVSVSDYHAVYTVKSVSQ